MLPGLYPPVTCAGWGLPSIDPMCLAVHAALRFARVQCKTAEASESMHSSGMWFSCIVVIDNEWLAGQLPLLALGTGDVQAVVADFANICGIISKRVRPSFSICSSE